MGLEDEAAEDEAAEDEAAEDEGFELASEELASEEEDSGASGREEAPEELSGAVDAVSEEGEDSVFTCFDLQAQRPKTKATASVKQTIFLI